MLCIVRCIGFLASSHSILIDSIGSDTVFIIYRLGCY